MNRGRFITIEGIEGTGKSTNIEFVTDLIKSHGFNVITAREPGGTPMAEQIRELLLEHRQEALPPIAELLLFFASRSLLLNNSVIPALDNGTWVVCDRFTDATRAYQGSGRGLETEYIEALATWVQEGLEPDLTILLDAPAEIGIERTRRRGKGDRMDNQELAFYERVRVGYLKLAEANHERFVIVDASQVLDTVQESIADTMRRLLPDK